MTDQLERVEQGTDPVLARMNLEPRPVHPSWEIHAEVLRAAQHWHTRTSEHIRCRCDQSIAAPGWWTVGELATSLLAHLMQAHGWTRESTG